MNCEGASRVTVLKEICELAIVTRRSTNVGDMAQPRSAKPSPRRGEEILVTKFSVWSSGGVFSPCDVRIFFVPLREDRA